MKYRIEKDKIKIIGKEDFNVFHILECGQIFAFDKNVVYSGKEKAEIIENEEGFEIISTNAGYFENFFDLKTDYSKIKLNLKNYPILTGPIKYGSGIRILKNDIFEVLISFIISANNNIKRIKLILSRLRLNLGENMGDYYAFPSYEKLKGASQNFFEEVGCGYRAKYLYKVLREVTPNELASWQKLSTCDLKEKLINLSGIGPKVADCIMLFGYGRKDVFPVDTWISKMYNLYYQKEENRSIIRKNLLSEFGDLSGYAQQYLFFWQRNYLKK